AIVLPVAADAVNHVAVWELFVANWPAVEWIRRHGNEGVWDQFLQRSGQAVFVSESVAFDGQRGLRSAEITYSDNIFVHSFLQTGKEQARKDERILASLHVLYSTACFL